MPSTMQVELGFDGQPLSRLARQVPKPKPSGIKNVDIQRQADYAKEVDIIDRMHKKCIIIGPLHGLLLSNNLEGIASAHSLDKDWSGKYQQLCRLPTWFMCQWLIDHAEEERVSAVVDKDLLCTLEGKQSRTHFDAHAVGAPVACHSGSPILIFRSRSMCIGPQHEGRGGGTQTCNIGANWGICP